MNVDLSEKELLHLYELARGTHAENILFDKVPKDLLNMKINLKHCTVLFNPKDDYISVGNIVIPLEILFEIGEVVNSWGIVVKAVQALECQNYVAHKFFSFPQFFIDCGLISLAKDLFIVHVDGTYLPLFTVEEIKDLIRDVKKSIPRKTH